MLAKLGWGEPDNRLWGATLNERDWGGDYISGPQSFAKGMSGKNGYGAASAKVGGDGRGARKGHNNPLRAPGE